ncbi:MAG: DUF126 domain-containing protein [Chloroflexi bacterium]|nr:DUF126 domain-containing protein [Chloroflexota bacterium]
MSIAVMTFRVRQAIGPVVDGPALVDPVPFSARYDLDRETGRISRAGHPLEGQSLAGKIILCPGVQGGVAAGWALLAMKALGHGLRGMVFQRVNPVIVQGAQAAGIPIAGGVDEEIFRHVQTGMTVRVDPVGKEVLILEA